jgi:ABC-2 type transport system permease protein
VRVIDLALKDLMQTVRDWKAAAFLLAMPIAFTLLFGAIFSNVDGEGDPRLPVGFLDQDGGSVLSTHLLHLLNASDAVRPVVLEGEDVDDVEKQVSDEDLAGAIIVPAGYSERTLGQEAGQAPTSDEVQLTVIVDEASSAGTTVKNGFQTAVARLLGSVQTARLTAQAFEAQGGHVDDVFLEETLDKAIAAWEEPALTVSVSQSGAAVEAVENEAEQADDQNAYAHSSPAMMIQFSIAGLIGSAEILVLERKSRALQRLLTTAISRLEIVLGHFLAIFALIFVQLVLLVGFGQLVLGVDYMRDPLATLLVMVTMALWTGSLGLLIGVVSKTQEQAVMFAMIPMFILSALGGAWMPLEFTSKTFQTIGHLTPTAWAMDGFQNVVVRGLGLSSVLAPAGIMLAYAVVLFALAVWRLRFE